MASKPAPQQRSRFWRDCPGVTLGARRRRLLTTGAAAPPRAWPHGPIPAVTVDRARKRVAPPQFTNGACPRHNWHARHETRDSCRPLCGGRQAAEAPCSAGTRMDPGRPPRIRVRPEWPGGRKRSGARACEGLPAAAEPRLGGS